MSGRRQKSENLITMHKQGDCGQREEVPGGKGRQVSRKEEKGEIWPNEQRAGADPVSH